MENTKWFNADIKNSETVFFSEMTGEGTATEPAKDTSKTEGTGTNTDENIEKAIEKGKEQKENAILKSFFKQQGMTEEEITEAIKNWKDNKAAEAKAAEDAKKAAEDAKDIAIKNAEAQRDAALKELNTMKINNALEKEAISLGADPTRLSIILRMSNPDNISFDDAGNIDTEAVKKEIESVLELIPELKAKPATESAFNFGGKKAGEENTQRKDTKNMNYKEHLRAHYDSK